LNELLPQAFAHRRVFSSLPLLFNIAPARGGSIEDMVCGLNPARSFEFAQQFARGYQARPFVDNGATLLHVGVFEQQQGFGCRVAAKKPLEGFYCRLLAEPANRTAFLETPLLIDADIGRDDPYRFQMVVDPCDDLISPRRPMNTRRFDVDASGILTGNPGRSSTSRASARTNVNSGEVSVTIRLNGWFMPAAISALHG
jgi:hypothetical protein